MCHDLSATDTPHFDESARVVSNEQLGERLYKICLHAPRMAATLRPGQFVHMFIPGRSDCILRRPFSVYECHDDTGQVDIVYQVVGTLTAHMVSLKTGELCKLMGPLGRGWDYVEECRARFEDECTHRNEQLSPRKVLLVGGGVGAAPLLLYAQKLCTSGVDTTIVLGAQKREMAVYSLEFEKAHPTCIRYATDDGSFGHHGFCTDLVQEELESGVYSDVVCCGPEPLMKRVALMCENQSAHQTHALNCYVSMERRMACGIGACLSCVVETHEGKKRSCVDGPVFNAKDVVW